MVSAFSGFLARRRSLPVSDATPNAKINKKICWYCGSSVCPPAARWVCEDCYVVCCTRCFRPEVMLCGDCFEEYMVYPPGSEVPDVELFPVDALSGI